MINNDNDDDDQQEMDLVHGLLDSIKSILNITIPCDSLHTYWDIHDY